MVAVKLGPDAAVNITPVSTVLMTKGGAPVVQSTRAGLLYCRSHREGWCDDIEAAIKAGSDSRSIFEDYYENNVESLMVPILPNDYFIYAFVGLESLSNTMLQAFLWDGAGNPPSPDNGIKIGVISNGDGRIQLRQMVLDWLLPNLDKPPIKCNGVNHNWKRKALLEQQWKSGDKKAAVAHHWCIRWFGLCAICVTEDGTRNKFAGDLIPDS